MLKGDNVEESPVPEKRRALSMSGFCCHAQRVTAAGGSVRGAHCPNRLAVCKSSLKRRMAGVLSLFLCQTQMA